MADRERKVLYLIRRIGVRGTRGMDLDAQLADFMKPLFGDMAQRTIQLQKDRLGLKGDLGRDGYLSVVKSIVSICRGMAGDAIARRMEDGLTKIVMQAS
jgi:hypothetical protein